ncbi:hypothetical protein S245_063450, partial [Arachis hypogaea]
SGGIVEATEETIMASSRLKWETSDEGLKKWAEHSRGPLIPNFRSLEQCVDIGVLKLGICLGYGCLSDRELASNGKFQEKLKGDGLFLIKLFGVLV